jgi:hypothetical protein
MYFTCVCIYCTINHWMALIVRYDMAHCLELKKLVWSIYILQQYCISRCMTVIGYRTYHISYKKSRNIDHLNIFIIEASIFAHINSRAPVYFRLFDCLTHTSMTSQYVFRNLLHRRTTRSKTCGILNIHI